MPAQSNGFPAARWKLLKKLYSFRWIYSLWGNRDIAFTSKDAIIHRIPQALNEVLYKNESSACFMMHLIFKGHLRGMKEEDLPPSLQENVLSSIKKRLVSGSMNIRYCHTDLLSFMKNWETKAKQPVFYSVSDVLSFENQEYMRRILENSAGVGNMIVWRTFLRNRVSESTRIFDHGSLADLTERESTRMYQVFSISY